ncbi:uncharacterized protein LOC116201071 [Punica granatum]|uniref:Uncharacterized protein LOC116201071 n=1 Tax=Punica granatum TaxID=22663 RepID=A0A6P8CVK9_PUNGR|nr:uncharacterized protein LOC116201071 [Punica granatum]
MVIGGSSTTPSLSSLSARSFYPSSISPSLSSLRLSFSDGSLQSLHLSPPPPSQARRSPKLRGKFRSVNSMCLERASRQHQDGLLGSCLVEIDMCFWFEEPWLSTCSSRWIESRDCSVSVANQ